jgi:hypothetical protein
LTKISKGNAFVWEWIARPRAELIAARLLNCGDVGSRAAAFLAALSHIVPGG